MSLSFIGCWMLRALILGLVGVAVVFEPRVPVLGPPPPPVLVVDVSASLGRGPFGPPREVQVAARWYAVADGVQPLESRQAASGLPRGATRLADALQRVAAEHPGRGVWIVTDGRGTQPGGEAAARQIRETGGRLDVSAPRQPVADVGLLEASAGRLPSGGARVRVRVASSVSGQGELLLLRDGERAGAERIRVEPQTERVVEIDDPSAPPQPVAYRVRWTPGAGCPDDDDRNDELALGLRSPSPAVVVWGDLPPRVWVGEGMGFQLRRMRAWEPGALEAADLVVLANLPWARIGSARVRELVRFTAGGGRLLLLGGPRAWRAGGWAGTPLEDDLSPLRTPRKEGLDLVLVIALDKSGSTAREALGHLTGAARYGLEGKKPGERVMVLPFDVQAGAPIEEADGLRGIEAGGGTDLVQGIRAAMERATAVPARERRVLLLTDGDPDHRLDEAELQRLRTELDARDVGFSGLVSRSPEVARLLGARLARDPEDVRPLQSAAEIPEALLRGLGEIRGESERRDAPTRIRWHGAADAELQGLRPSWVQALEPTPEGRVGAEAVWPDRALPFAARRTLGAGEVFALAWGPSAEDVPSEAAGRLTRWIATLAASADRGLRAEVEGADVVVHAPSARGAGQLWLEAAGEASRLLEEGPGIFRGPLPCDCRLGVQVTFSGTTRPVDMPAMAPIEHRGAGVDEAGLLRLARAGGGRRLAEGEEPPRGAPADGAPLAPWLLLLALVLFLVDRWRAT